MVILASIARIALITVEMQTVLRMESALIYLQVNQNNRTIASTLAIDNIYHAMEARASKYH